MSSVEQLFRSVRLTSFCLLQSADIDVYAMPNLALIRCNGVVTSDSFTALQRLIPTPTPPRDARQRRMFRDHVVGKDRRWDVENDAAVFDAGLDHHHSGASDLDVYGESYTIVVMTPPELAPTMGYLVGLLTEFTGRIEGKIDGLNLYDFWDEVMDRLVFWPEADDGWKLRLEIIDGLKQRLNAMPGGTTEADWEELEEWLFK